VQVGDKIYTATPAPTSTTATPLYTFDWREPLYSATYEVIPYDTDARQVWTTLSTLPLGSALGYQGTAYQGDAITVALNLMLSQPGSASPYSLDVDFGIRLPTVGVDVNACEQLRAVIQNEILVPNFIWGLEENADKLTLDLLEAKLLNPFNLSFGEGPDGLAIVRLFDAQPVFEPFRTIDTTNLVADTQVSTDIGWDDTISDVTAKYDTRPGIGSRTLNNQDAKLRSRRLGNAGEITLDLGSVSNRETVQNTLTDFAARWRLPLPLITFALHPSDVIPLGGGAELTFLGVVGRQADHGGYPIEGVKGSRVVVESRTLGLDRNIYTARQVGLRYDRTGRRTSSAQITAYNDLTRTFTVSAAKFVQAGHPSYTNDLESFEVGDVIQWRQATDGTQVAAGMVVESITLPDTLVVTVSPGAIVPGFGDVLFNYEYDASTTDQQDRHAYTADTDATVGADGDLGYQYQG